ncbi:transient receptor potential cation channel subfamily V member 3-like isoform X1 [Gigantopelta aegis]|uniref:transient receptor potential cation channel subfamily V member 3-like isoform X1 n=1 Tax=Gigantopelta aegis TaxID=1735272 RepID=UPI001B88A20C|nr:transient receptor potential cation channel subfamily V member 3-like isoform X1 [Gigantopelta aegis]
MDEMDFVKKKKTRSKVSPSEEVGDTRGIENPTFGMEPGNHVAPFNFQNAVHEVGNKVHMLEAVTNVKHHAAKWKTYVTRRRLRKRTAVIHEEEDHLSRDLKEKEKLPQSGLADIHDDFVNPHTNLKASSSKGLRDQKMCVASNQALIQYFAKLGQSCDENETINLEFVDTLIRSGANVNCTDKYGQTVLHEVARTWHVDVGRYLLEHGANINQPDFYGRTPLHVAAAVDYPEMVNLLIENKADKEALTMEGEGQTPVHYAAKTDACRSLKALIKKGCQYKTVRDHKGRTPIHVAAELDRSETARLLLDLQAPVGVSDNSGRKAITWMITKMAPVASEALNQFRTTNRPKREQHFYLNLLVQDIDKDPEGKSQTPLQVAVAYRQYELVMNLVFVKLLDVQWKAFGRRGAWINLIINFLYILVWTVIGVLVEYDKRHIYQWPTDSWRVVLWLLAVGITVWQITEELKEYARSKKAHRNAVRERTREINEDLKFCHPQWPDERMFLESELKTLAKLNPNYFSDYWNIFDWLCYFLLLVSIITHLVDIGFHSDEIARSHIRVMSITIILLWLRLMKNARAFSVFGPFIVMLGHMMGDMLRFTFLYCEFYIPYVCAFWMLFGSDKKSSSGDGTVINVTWFNDIGQVMFSLFRMTLVDEYDYASMKQVDSVMADILIGTWLALSAILCLNLFIALLSDTFQRVYDNAQSNAVMQKAITILNIWEGMSKKRQMKFLKFVHTECNPKRDTYDDDVTTSGEEDLKKVTIQIKEELDELLEGWKAKFGHDDLSDMLNDAGDGGGGGNGGGGGSGGGGAGKVNRGAVVTVERFEKEIGVLHSGIMKLQADQVRRDSAMDSLKRDTNTIKSLLHELLGHTGAENDDGGYEETKPRREVEHHSTNVQDRSEGKVRRLRHRKHSKSQSQAAVDEHFRDQLHEPTGYTPRIEISTVHLPVQSGAQHPDHGDSAEC